MLVELLVGGTVGYLVGSSTKGRRRNPNPRQSNPKKKTVRPRRGQAMQWGKYSR